MATHARQMKTTLIAASVALALAQMAGAARADSGVGQDTSIGNALNPRPINTVTHGSKPDADGIGTNMPMAHTPFGPVFENPLSPTDNVSKTAGGWEYYGHVEVGAIGTDGDKNARDFKRYKDVDNGLLINNFGLAMEKADSANYVEITGGGVGRDDQFYSVKFGRYNDWKVKAFYNETPHVFTTSFRSIYDGIGTNNLTVKAGLTPGGTATVANDNAAVAAVANANAGTELGLVRRKGGVRFDKDLHNDWKFFASYTNEKREGARPFGSVWNAGGGTAPVETVEPINYNTHDVVAGLHYADDLNALNLQMSASWFRNHNDTLNFQTPYRVNTTATNGIAAGGFTQGTFDLYPDNDYYNLKADYARQLPSFYKGRFTASVAVASSRQNDNLVPYTSTPGVTLANVTTTAGNGWDTTGALSQQTAGARIDTKLINFGLALKPTNDLGVQGKVRYYETKNHTNYVACNPNASYVDNDSATAGNQAGGLNAYGCNGVWGRLINDGSGAAILMATNSTTAGNVNIRSIPYDYKQLVYSLSGDYRINRTNSLSFGYERESYDRDHREREETWENKFKLGYINRGVEDGTIRLSFENNKRRGDEYHTHHPYADYYSGSIVAMPTTAGANVQTWEVHMNEGLRKYDISDRDQNILNARFNYMLRPDLDLGVMAQLKDIKYPNSTFGRTDKQTQNSLNLDLTYQPSSERSVYGFYSYQQGKLNQKGNVSGNIAATPTLYNSTGAALTALGCTIGTVTPLGTITAENAESICQNSVSNTVWLLANGWSVNHKDNADVLGFGWKEVFGEKLLDLNYSYAKSKTAISYSQAAGTSLSQAELAGSGMPELTTIQHVFEASLLVPINKKVSTRFVFRHEIGKIKDWHYLGLQSTPVAVAAGGAALPTAVILDAGPQDYKASLIGVVFNIKI